MQGVKPQMFMLMTAGDVEGYSSLSPDTFLYVFKLLFFLSFTDHF